MNETQVGWIAGLIEGEGTIEFVSQGSVRISVVMTDLDVLEQLKDMTGVGKISVAREPSKCQEAGRKQQYRWRVGRREQVEPLLRAILPWMGSRRTDRIEEALKKLSTVYVRPKADIVHGTTAGYRKERHRNMTVCDPCRQAYNEDRRERRK